VFLEIQLTGIGTLPAQAFNLNHKIIIIGTPL